MRKIYLGQNMMYAGLFVMFMFLLSWQFPLIFIIAQISFFFFISLIVFDYIILFYKKNALLAERRMTSKFSNGDDNPVEIVIENKYPFAVKAEIIDEIPIQFQRRDIHWAIQLPAYSTKSFHYALRPVKRGIYNFGVVNIYAKSYIGFLKRRYELESERDVAVYPSFLQMRKYELAAFAKQYYPMGIKRIRKIGQTMEFEQIKEYVSGDDPRFVNWKASAKRNQLMVNQYQDQKSQQVYSIVDKGRLMKMPFEGLSLLDYAINSSLVISNIAIKKGDKAGVVSFAFKMSGYLPALKNSKQMYRIQEFLYAQKTQYKESNFEVLQSFAQRNLGQRSLLLLYTNFESLSSLKRQLPYLQSIAKKHLLVIIFFQNTHLLQISESAPEDIRGVYHQVIANNQFYEKSLIVKELKKHGIFSILTTPNNLTVNTINKYLEIKSRGLL